VTKEIGAFPEHVLNSEMIASDPSYPLTEVMSKVTAMKPTSLRAVHLFIQMLELNALGEDIKDEAEGLRVSGKLEPSLLHAAIAEHRQKHG
jgi:hypothetical protein